MIFPRLSALSEVLWSPKADRNWNDFEKKLSAQFKRYELWKANYSKAYFDLKTKVTPTTDNNGILWKLESKFKDAKIQYTTGRSTQLANYVEPIKINSTNIYSAKLFSNNKLVSSIEESFYFNKATGQKITLAKNPSRSYPGDGAFTLVNGIQNTWGLSRSKEFLGFEGENCEAILDFGKEISLSSVTIHSLRQTGSWIWRPLTLEVFLSEDGKTFTSAGLTDNFKAKISGNGTMTVSFKSAKARYTKVVVTNWGAIPADEPGAGNKAWLFVDEIEVN
jgi:hexosaminidase